MQHCATVHFSAQDTSDGLATKTSPGGQDKMLSQSYTSGRTEVSGRLADLPPASAGFFTIALGAAKTDAATGDRALFLSPRSAQARGSSCGAAKSKKKLTTTAMMMRAGAFIVTGCGQAVGRSE